jgi:endogenous inhibitor of DNA gyrase (YacG/DUF329 family)
VRKETMANKLVELLGLSPELKVDVNSKGVAKKVEPKNKNLPVGITEAEIQSAREAQAVTYFLQAPDLFSFKTCPHCGETFAVSRVFVAFCSYTCIAKDLENKGIRWSRLDESGNINVDEDYVKRVWEGNEPLWIKETSLSRLKAFFERGPVASLIDVSKTA